MQKTVEHPTEIVAISSDTTVKSAAIMMFNSRIGCLIVNDRTGKFAGIVTERDIVGKAVASSMDLEKTAISKIMTPRVVSCPVGTSAGKARELMASNHIRHLPVVDNGVVVEIFSARDLMGQQLLEDRAAAEEVAMLSNCLKSIELNEAVETVTKEAPKLFQAVRCVLRLYKTDPGAKNATRQDRTLVSCNECVCPKEQLMDPADSDILFNVSGFYHGKIPCDCKKAGAQGPRLVMPLSIAPRKLDQKGKMSGYLCMCGLAHWTTLNRELTSYKAKLTKEILTSHLTNASLYHQARLSSLTDALTAVGSRRLLEDKLEAECTRAKRYKCPFSLAMIDLDNFKTINDMLGHTTGDDALRKLAECMKSQKRIPDILARYGGDEFVILMPETEANAAVTLLERFRAHIQQIEVAENVSMTISCGIAQSKPNCDDSCTDVVRRADIALYAAKSAGRNCVKIWNKSMSKALGAGDIQVDKIEQLKRRIASMSLQAEKTFIQSIRGLVQALALKAKDPYVKYHSENVMHYAVAIARMMKLSPKQVDVIRRAAMVHDIGMIGIPDAILFKPGGLTPHERKIIEQHPLITVRILKKMSYLKKEMAIVLAHHEKWNGQGYPNGLSGTAIPLGARILAVADTFDAVTSNRSYRSSRSLDETIGLLVDSSGYDFDPDVVEAMVSWIGEVRSQLGDADQLTPEDLLESQKRLDQDLMPEPVADACAVEG
jgi:diguanylate cyclase (GGDEF)-like protein